MAGDSPRTTLLLLVAVSLVILLSGSATLPLLDRDEPRFSRATVEMTERGDWVVPFFNGEYRFDKPPLTYWLMAAGYATLGVGEIGARMHAILASTLLALAIFLFGRRLFNARVGFAAAFAWATCVQVFLHGRLALADMPMVLAVLAANWALYELLLGAAQPRFGRWFWVLWGALALGFLAKGPVAVAVPALTALLTRAFRGRRGLPWRSLQLQHGLPLALAVVGAWGIPALVRTGGAFWQVGIGEHVVRRGVESFNDRPVLPFYYLVTIFLSLFPWSPWLGQAAVEVRRNWGDDRNRFLMAWVLGPFLIFSFYTTQLPHYTMPAFPAILLLALRPGVSPTTMERGARWFWLGLHGLLGGAFLVGLLYLASLSLPAESSALRWAAVPLVGVLLALQAVALLFARAWRRDAGDSGAGTRALRPALAAVVAVALFTSLFAAAIRPLSVSALLQPIFNLLPVDTVRVARGYTEPSLVFYARGPWDLNTTAPDVAGLLASGQPLLLVYRAHEAGLDRLLRPGAGPAFADVPLVDLARTAGVPRALVSSDLERARIRGFNFARATWTELIVFYRR